MANVVWIAYCMDCDTQLTENEGRRGKCPTCKEEEGEE